MYLSQQIDDALEDNRDKFVGVLSYSTLIRRLGHAFNFPKDLKFKYEVYGDIEQDSYTVSGLYDMAFDKKYVIFNLSKYSNDINLCKYDFQEFKFLVSQVIQHETIHQDQWQHREGTEDPIRLDFRNVIGSLVEERSYLSDIDEIDAYAHDIAMEIAHYYPKENPFVVLKNINKKRKLPSYNYYKHTFKNTNWAKVKNRLLTKTYGWIPYV